MNFFEKLYSIDNPLIQRSINIEDNLYSHLKQLIGTKYDSTISDLVNVYLELYVEKNNPQYYKKPQNETVTYRSIMIRKNNILRIEEMREKTGISFSRLVNTAIKEALVESENIIL